MLAPSATMRSALWRHAVAADRRHPRARSQALNEQRMDRLELEAKLGRSPPKKGQGKRSGRKK